MDEFVKTKLTEWDLVSLIKVFEENAVDEEVFNALNDEMIKDLIPQIGLRYKFANKYKSFMASIIPDTCNSAILNEDSFNSDALSESTTVSIASTSSSVLLSEVPRKFVRKSVREILEQDPKGKEIMARFKTCGTVDQAKLAALLVDKELENDPDARISSALFTNWAKSIADIFPNIERAETYYSAYTVGESGPISANGILWNRYLNTRRIYQKIGMINLHKKNSSISKPIVSKEAEEAVAWLKYNVEPFDIVQEKWRETHDRRIKFDTCLGIAVYFDIYKCLKLPNGHTLIDIDFEHLYADKKNQLFVEWPKVARQVIAVAKTRKDNDIKTLLSVHAALIEAENVEVLALLILPLLLNAASVKSKKAGNHWRPSRLEVQRGFLLHTETVDDLEPMLSSRLKIIEKYKLTNQPLPVIIGPLENIVSSMVLINDTIGTQYPLH